MTQISRAPFAPPTCPAPTYGPTPLPATALCSTALPDLRLDDARNLSSNRFDILSAPRWRRWSPQVVTPKRDRLVRPGTHLDAQTRVVVAAVNSAREHLQVPIGNAPFVLLSDDAFHAALTEMAWPADEAVFRQPNGVVLINHERAFGGQGTDTHFTARSLALINAACRADFYQIMCRKNPPIAKLLPVRFHPEEDFSTPEEAIAAFADFTFKSVAANDDTLQKVSESEQALLKDFNRLLDLPSRQAPRTGSVAVALISKTVTYTTVIYANLLSERINPLLDQPIRVADHIERLDILFDHPRLPGNAVAQAILDISETPQQQRPLVVQGVAVDPHGELVLSDTDILHELVHAAADGNLLKDLPNLADETLGPPPPLRTSKEVCHHLLHSRAYVSEILTEWITHTLVARGHPDAGRSQLMGRHVVDKLFEGGRLNNYKAGFYTAEVAYFGEGDRLIGDLLGKPSPANIGERTAKAQSLLPRLHRYCEIAVKLIVQRGEMQ
jgi:hypothetical protein